MKKVGNYVFDSMIGEGTLGEFCKAHHDETKEVFAIKAIKKAKLENTPKLKEYLKDEKEIMSAIKHPNIMHLYDVFETEHKVYLVIDYCKSGTMEAYVKKRNGLGEDDATYFLMQIMNGFKELHKRKVMHRDLKLSTIFLNGDRAIIGNFGKCKQGQTIAQTELGHPYTTAPEILFHSNEQVYTNKADIWSIGVCFFEMIYGISPWRNAHINQNFHDVILRNSGSELKFPTDLLFTISEECKQLLISLIEVDPLKQHLI